MSLLIAAPLFILASGAVLSRRVRSRNRQLVLALSVILAVLAFVAGVARNPSLL